MKIVYFEITFLYLIVRTASFPVEDADDDDESGHLGHIYNSGSPLYFDNGHHNEYNEYPGYDGYASYAPHHDHEHYAYPRYKFEYGVHDPHTGDIKKQYEERDGDVVRGFYSLVEPDGSIRIVEYTADDKHGFQATVRKIGPSHHPHPPTHHSEHHNHNYPYDDHHHPYEDHYQPYPHHEVSNYFPSHYPNPYGSEEDNGYGYNVYEHPNPYGYGDQNNAYYHYGLGGQEYDDNEDYPYHSNTNYPTYVLPQNTYSAIQDLTSYGESHVDIENPDKYYYKRSPVKKFDLKEHSQPHPSVKPFKENSAIKPSKEVKKLEQSETKEIKAEVKISTTPSNELGKSQKKT